MRIITERALMHNPSFCDCRGYLYARYSTVTREVEIPLFIPYYYNNDTSNTIMTILNQRLAKG